MNDSVLVVLTYPGHYLLTALSLKSYLKYHPTPERLIIVLDDISDKTWPSYITDCYQLYSSIVPTVELRQTSTLPEAHRFDSGWIRQQIVKLHLDLLVDADRWFFTDGDIVFLHPVESNMVPYTLIGPIDGQNEYIQRVLGIDQAGIFVDGNQICVNDPPFRTMHRQTLCDIRNHVEQTHNRSISDVHLDYQNKLSIRITEWELLESFKLYVQGITPNLIRYAPHSLMDIPDNLNFFTHQFLTCYNADQDFGREWFAKQDIVVTDDMWNRLTEIRR